MSNEGFRRGMIVPTLISQLKGILEQYPDDGQILKEIIQNAEDAEATRVIFMMDNTTYGTDPEKLYHPDLAKYQGPALYAYNDALFTERDWDGIRRMYDSIKADDPLKVGKFGLGFKPVFHMTDIPSIYSEHRIGFLDPHKRFFQINVPGQSQPEKTSSYDWNFRIEEDRQDLQRLSQMFQPYIQEAFGVTTENFQSGNFNGTMFRFPLRNSTMHSDLSKNVYDEQKVQQLLSSLEKEACNILLFLKHVRQIQFYEKDNGSIRQLINIKVTDKVLEDVIQKCCQLSKHILSNTTHWYKNKSCTVSYPLEIEVTNSFGNKEKSMWIVTQHFGGKNSNPTSRELIDGRLPLVGVASKSSDETFHRDDISRRQEPYGQVFCFLPLPLEEKSPTGFNFHVHGSFAVDQNRRHLKWTSADQDHSKVQDKDLIWNKFLIEKVLPVCLKNHYKHLLNRQDNIMDANILQKNALQIYSILPDQNVVDHHWNNFVNSFRDIIADALKLFSVVTLRWMPSMPYILFTNKNEIDELNTKIMLNDNRNLACIPTHVLQYVSPRIGTPLSADEICEAYRGIQDRLDVSEGEKFALLNHFCKNLTNVKKLIGINLLPLSDGTWTSFQNCSTTNMIFVCNDDYPERLFPTLKNRILGSKKRFSLQELSIMNNFNLCYVDRNEFVNLLRSIMGHILENEIVINNFDWFNLDWLKLVWAHISRDHPFNLSPFFGLHLVLIENNRVARLSSYPTLIGTSPGDNKIDDRTKIICDKLRIPLVETHRDDMYTHPSLWGTCILPSKMRSVLSFMLQTHNPPRTALFETLTESESTHFVSALALEMLLTWSLPLTAQEQSLLKSLNIFKTINNSGRVKNSSVSLRDVNMGIAVGEYLEIPVPSCAILLDLSNDSIKQLACGLTAKLLNRQSLLEQAYIPGIQKKFYSQEEVQLLMQYICRNMKFISTPSCRTLYGLEFVIKSKSKTLAKPKDLFDHKQKDLMILLKEDNFPSEIWRNNEFYEALVSLGMKNADYVNVEDCINIVRDMTASSNPSNYERFFTFIGFLNERPKLLNERFRDETKELNWIAIKKIKPAGYPPSLEYFGENEIRNFARVNEVVSCSFENIAGSSCLMVDSSRFQAVERLLGWNSGPSLSTVIQHLRNLVESYNSTNKIEMLAQINKIYEYLNSCPKKYLRKAFDFPWIWIGDGFTEQSKVVTNQSEFLLEPYFYVLPPEIKIHHNLWKCFNIPTKADFVKTLELIKCYHEDTRGVDKNRTSRDTELAISILNHLVETKSGLTIDAEIFVPIKTSCNSCLKMELRQNCVYCDKQWYQLGFDVEDLGENIHLIHELIPMCTAEKLNIASCLSRMLNTEEIDCSFGQTESLTTRLRGLLKDYTDGLTVLKELIQNADDAGAIEIVFVYDERKNENCRSILLDENMIDLQGPAIWCYNNAQFSKEDFENIQMIGGATKESINTKIGMFGLGFNSVYNLTDVPILISNDYIVFFDPHTKYLNKAISNKSSPGIKLNLRSNHKKICRLKDQFAPFNGMFGCDFSPDSKMENYNGTLFRFPLRTKLQAESSQICNRHYNRNEVMELLKCLIVAGEDLLMFTQNVDKITICHIEENSKVSNMTEIFNVSRRMEEIIRNPFGVINFDYLNSLQSSIGRTSKCEFVYKMTINMSHNDNPTQELKMKSTDSRSSSWIVSWCSGVGKSFDLFTKDSSYLPIGAVAAKLGRIKNNTLDVINLSKDEQGKVYCFMPFPHHTSLPVHVNGYFALNSSRTHMYVRSVGDKEDKRWIWNEALLSDAIPAAYCNLIQNLASTSVLDLYKVFPDRSSCHNSPCFKILLDSVYDMIFSTDMQVFRSIVDEEMFKIKDCLIVGRELQIQCFSQAIETVLKCIGKYFGLHIVNLPDNIYDYVLNSRHAVFINDLIIGVTCFYKKLFVDYLILIPKQEREEIIVQTLIDGELCNHLRTVSCIPATPCGETFRHIDELIDPNSSIAVLYDDEDQRFPCIPVHLKEEDKRCYLETLARFGMRSESLPDDDVVDRCHFIEKNQFNHAKRLSVLLKLIEKNIKSKLCAPDFKNKIRFIKIFPKMKKPNFYPYHWKESEFDFLSCEEGYLEKKMLPAGPSCHIIDENQSFKGGYTFFKKAFNLENKPLSYHSVEVVVKEIGKHFNENDSYSIKNKEFVNVINKTLAQLYDEVDSIIEHDAVETSEAVNISKMRFILTNSLPHRLLLPSQCSQTLHKSLLPYMCGVNETSLKSSSSFWSKIRVKEKFDVSDFLTLLEKIENQFCGNKLNIVAMNLVMNVLECIYDAVAIDKQLPPEEFFLPNKQEIMQPSSRLKYNDCKWHQLNIAEYVHDRISKSMASIFGVKSVSEDSFDKYALFYHFGQNEKLVSRINRILEGYPLNEDIFKELLQNADDARASKIHFVHDFRNLPATKIFSDEWKCLQGPSLCVYNDKSFTSNDLEGIQQLGEGSKQGDITKTGQYGVGFNCVYHLTDAPSLLTTVKSAEPQVMNNADISGTVLGIFDPNCTFLPKATTSHPGGMYKADLVTKMYKDVYEGYLQNFHQYNVGVEGTMFRLPLRNNESKNLSKIKGGIVSSFQLVDIMKKFQTDLHHSLLFLKSVESLSLVNVKSNPTDDNVIAENFKTVKLEFGEESRMAKDRLMKFSYKICALLQQKLIKLEDISSYQTSYRVNVCDSESKPSKWILMQIFGFEDSSLLNPRMLEAYNEGRLNFQPCGGVAFPEEFFEQNKPRFQGRIYSNLPLPILTHLPVHINGHFVLNHESRRDLWTDENGAINLAWNEAVLSQLIVPAYCSLLKYLKDTKFCKLSNFREALVRYYDLFPNNETDAHAKIKYMTKEIYKYVLRKKLAIFLLYRSGSDNDDQLEWIHVHDGVFFDDLPKSFFNDRVHRLRDTLYSCGLKIIDSPIRIFYNLHAVDANVSKITQENVLKHFYSSSSFNDLPDKIENTPFQTVEGLIEVLKYVITPTMDHSKVKDLPLLLTTDNVLKRLSLDDRPFESKYSDVAPHKLGQFIHPSVERVFLGSKIAESFIRQMDISCLAMLLKDFLPNEWTFCYQQKQFKLEKLYEIFAEKKHCEKWLQGIWNIIEKLHCCNELENQLQINKCPKILDLNPIQHLYLIPVTINGGEYLYPISKRLAILKPLDFRLNSSNKLHDALIKAGIPTLDMNYCKNIHNARSIFGDVNNPGDVLCALEDIYINLNLNTNLETEYGSEILRYFSRNTAAIRQIGNGKTVLKSLPFYSAMNGQQVSLMGDTIYLFPEEIPIFDVNVLPKSNTYLKDDNMLQDLFQFLNCKKLSVYDVYSKFIFETFSKFNEEVQWKHLKYIKILADQHLFNQPEHLFMESLKTFKFIYYLDNWHSASYFYDRDKRIFELMKERFTPSPFDGKDWKDFLIKCGLKSKLSEKRFLKYANEVCRMKENAVEVQSLLIEILLKTEEFAESKKFLAGVRTIPFIVPLKIDNELLIIHSSYSTSEFISFENSYLLCNDVNLCWTVCNVLPRRLTSLKKEVLKKLNVRTELDVETVVRNLSNVSLGFKFFSNSYKGSVDKSEDLIKNLTEEHLSWLSKHSNDINNATLMKLRSTNCVYVADLRQLVKPTQVVTDICKGDQILPHIVRIPGIYGKYEQFLYKLGATKSITTGQCADALESIKSIVGDIKMDYQNKNNSSELFRKILELVEKDSNQLSQIKKLFIPCNDGILCDSQNVYCTENKDIETFAHNLDRPLYTTISRKLKLLRKFPIPIQPTVIDDYLKEELVTIGEDISPNMIISKYERKIRHPNFLDGMVCIKNHLLQESDRSDACLELMQEKLSGILNKITFASKDQLKVHCLLNGNAIKGSVINVEYFIEFDDLNETLKIYASSKLNEECFVKALAINLSKFCEMITKEKLIKKILKKDSHLIAECLEELSIDRIMLDVKIPLGNEIAIENHFTLVQDVLILFPSQLVAYEINDPFDNKEDGEAKYVLVKIVEAKRNEVSKFLMKYEINFGEHTEVVDAVKLYAFKSTNCKNEELIMIPSSHIQDSHQSTKMSASVSEMVEKVKQEVKEIWKLDENQRKKAIKRLFLQYHPDKNQNNQTIYGEVFKHLKILIDKMEKGETIDDYKAERQNKTATFHFTSDFFDDDYFDRMDKRAKKQKYANTKKSGGYSKTSSGSYNRQYRQFFNEYCHKARRDPAASMMWMTHARHDQQAAMNDIETGEYGINSPKWSCIKCYHAVRNAIKAVGLSKDANNIFPVDKTLKDCCSEIYDQYLDSLVSEMNELLIDEASLVHPSSSKHVFGKITAEMATQAHELTDKILCRCNELINEYNTY